MQVFLCRLLCTACRIFVTTLYCCDLTFCNFETWYFLYWINDDVLQVQPKVITSWH